MSLINKMLQDLDRRQGAAAPDATLVQQVRSVALVRKEREWFWRIIAVLMIGAVAWVGWLAWHLQPREPLATDQAFKAAQNAPRYPPSLPATAPPKPTASEPAEPKRAEAAPAAEKPPPLAAEAMKLAPGIEAPIREQARKPAIKSPAQSVAVAPVAVAKGGASAGTATRLDLDVPPARILPGPAQAAARVEKRDRARTPDERAESEFRRAAMLLNQGRVAEAEDGFAAALNISAAHEAARQALVALHLEHGRIDEARRLLQEGVALNQGNARFASVLARIYMERRDYAAALEVLGGVRNPELNEPELQSMRGSVLQKMGRHAEAVDAFQNSLRGMPQNGAAWLGLGISLDALGRRSEAAESFRRASAAGTLGAEARGYAEQRARQLQ